MDSDIQLYSTKVSVLSIPRENFWLFKSGVLRLLYRAEEGYRSSSDYDPDLSASSADDDTSSKSSEDLDGLESEDDGLFFHLAFTPGEVTLMTATKWIKRFLKEPMKMCPEATLLETQFLVLQVLSDGLNIGKTILQVTEPLAEDGISLFFISNFFSDIVLVPAKKKQRVLEVLAQDRETSPTDGPSQIEDQTFELFKEQSIKPQVVTSKVVLTGARTGESSAVLKHTAELLARSGTGPGEAFSSYFAITRTATGEVSLMLPEAKVPYDRSRIMGSLDPYYPVLIDLSKLPTNLKGIVAGVASRLVRSGLTGMSYMSLGRSGLVLTPDDKVDQVKQLM